ncbi:hypothetical protein AAV33_09625, partial [Corynebacterium otitidis]
GASLGAGAGRLSSSTPRFDAIDRALGEATKRAPLGSGSYGFAPGAWGSPGALPAGSGLGAGSGAGLAGWRSPATVPGSAGRAPGAPAGGAHSFLGLSSATGLLGESSRWGHVSWGSGLGAGAGATLAARVSRSERAVFSSVSTSSVSSVAGSRGRSLDQSASARAAGHDGEAVPIGAPPPGRTPT